LTKESVSLFSGSSFASKEEPQVWGAEPHPVPRSGTARKSYVQLGWNDACREGSAGGTLSPFGAAPSEEGALWGVGSFL